MLFGDSIAMGLGAHGRQYVHVLADWGGFDVVDRSHTGWTVQQSRDSFRERPEFAEVAIIAHGITEAILRPILPQSRLFPNRWKPRGWMDPRPYYSTRWHRRFLERIESAVRWRLRNLLTRRAHYQLMTAEQYVAALSGLVADLREQGSRVIMLQAPPIDDRYFPGSRAAQQHFWDLAVKSTIGAVEVVDLLGMHEWGHFLCDNFHPNMSGHEFIAKRLFDQLKVTSARET